MRSREDQRIFINENLTNYRRELFWKANRIKKDNMITSTWTMDGKIFVKIDQEANFYFLEEMFSRVSDEALWPLEK